MPGRLRERVRRILPGGATTAGGVAIFLFGLLALWLLSGIYFVSAREQGVVPRFGEYVARTPPASTITFPGPSRPSRRPK